MPNLFNMGNVNSWQDAVNEHMLGNAYEPYDIIERVLSKHSVDMVEVMGRSRERIVADARHEIWYFMKKLGGLSYPQIGKMFNRDHTTIMNGVNKHEKKIQDR